MTASTPELADATKAEPPSNALDLDGSEPQQVDRKRLLGDVTVVAQSVAITAAFYFIVLQIADDEWLSQPLSF